MANILFVSLLSLVLFSSVFSQNSTDPESDANTGTPIDCYVCKSDADGDCYDPVDINKLPKKSCPSGICLKYVQTVEKDIKQIDRGCADEVEPLLLKKEKDEGCVLSTGTKLVQLEICNCKTANCNSVAEMKAKAPMVLAAVALVFLVGAKLQ